MVSFWRSAGGTLFGGRIYANGDLGDHTGLDANTGRTALRLFPNPATDRLVLTADAAIGAVLVVGMDGRALQLPMVRRSSEVVLDITGLPGGTYAVRALTAAGPLVQRFIKP